jgi:CheY-like chemotaxis protein
MLRVLVVDDDRAIRELLRFALEAEGYAVTTFADGRGVVEVLAELTAPCVVLMDLSMPHTTGWDVCATLASFPRALGAHQIVILTGEALGEAECPRPACTLLAKPFDLDNVCRLVASLFAMSCMIPTTGVHDTLTPAAAPVR